MCMGLYPNVCLHQGKRKVLTTEGKPAVIHKTSVNCSNQEQRFPCPLFVFGEKVRMRAISCKQTTMVAPLHLLLFACRKVEWIDNVVRLDNWLNFDMKPSTAALVIALRPAVEKIVERAAAEPDAALHFSPIEQKVIDCVKSLCIVDAGDYNIQRETSTPTFRMDGAKRGNRGWGTTGPRGGFGGQGFGANQGFGGNRGGFGGTRGGFGGNRGGFGSGNQGGFGNEGQGGFGGGFQGGFRGSGGFGSNQGGFGGNQGGFGDNQGGFGSNQSGNGFGRGGFGSRGFGNTGFGNRGYGNSGFRRGGRGYW
ncbi:dosage compensation regulator-like [Trichoplusia ni]|nr:dosage compensation regulator-like [Trichoplusia ni]